jgi:hypothetical protein
VAFVERVLLRAGVFFAGGMYWSPFSIRQVQNACERRRRAHFRGFARG